MSGQIIGPIGVLPTVSSFTPASLTALKGWWKADVGVFSDTSGTTPSTNGTAVKYWQDQSGIGNHLISGASTSALLATGSINGLPALSYSAQAVQPLQASIALSNATGLSCFAVVLYNTVGSNDRIISMKGNGASDDASSLNSGCLILPSGAITLAFFEVSQLVTTTTAASTYYQMSYTLDGANVNLYLGNVAQGGSPVATANSFVTPLLFGVGAIVTAGTAPLSGSIAEVVLMNATATSGQRTNMQTYLFGRYGI